MATCIVGSNKASMQRDVFNKLLNTNNPDISKVLVDSGLSDDDLFETLLKIKDYLNKQTEQDIQRIGKSLYKTKVNLIQYALDHIAGLRYVPETIKKEADALIEPTTGKIPVFGKGLNDYFREDMTKEPFKALFYNTNDAVENKLKLSSSEKQAIINYRNSLFSNIIDYLIASGHSNIDYIDIYDQEGSIVNYGYYTSVMEAAYDLVSDSDFKDRLKSNSFDPQLLQMYEFVKSFYLLNNFDDFINRYFKDYITVDQSEYIYGALNIRQNKYKYTGQTKAFVRWNGDHSDHDANKNFSKLFFQFLRTVNVPGGRPLTMDDFHKISAYIQNRFSPSELDKFYNGTNEQLFELLVKYSQKMGDVLSRVNGADLIDTLIKALKDNEHELQSYKVKQRSFKEQQFINNSLDFISAFRAEVQNSISKTYLKETAESIDIESNAMLKQSKEAVRARLIAITLTNIRNGNYQLYSPNWFHIQKGINLFDPAFRTMFRHLTGFELTDEKAEKLKDLSNNKFDSTLQFLRDFCNFVYTKVLTSANPEQTLQDYLRSETLKNNSHWVSFSSLCVSENYVDSAKIRNQSNDQIPNATTGALGLDTKYNIARYQKQIGKVDEAAANQNILIKYSSLIDGSKESKTEDPQHIVSRLDVSYKDNRQEKVLTAIQLNPVQNAQVAINDEYFLSYIERDIMYNQITCTSNKKNIILGSFNVGATPELKKASTDNIILEWLNQHEAHYNALQKQLLNDYNKIIPLLPKTQENIILEPVKDINTAISILEKYSIKDILGTVHLYNLNNPSGDRIEFFKELHYSEGPDKKFRFNSYLYANMHPDYRKQFLKAVFKAGFNDFLKTATKVKIPSWLKDSSLIEKNKDKILWLFDAEENEFDSLKKFLTSSNREFWTINDKDDIKPKFIYRALRKYHALSCLFTDADLFLVSKHKDIQDKGKSMTLHDIQEELKTIKSDNVYSTKVNSLINAKINSDAKRSNIWNAPSTKQRKSPFGLGDKINIAIVEHQQSEVAMFDGKTDRYKANDGVIQTLGVATYWEKSSFPGRTFGDTKKTFCAAPSAFTITQIKCADFAITNSVIRNSFKEEDNNKNILLQNQNIIRRIEKMMSAGTFSKEFYENYAGVNLADNLGVNTAKYTDDGVLRVLLSIEIIPGTNAFIFKWGDVNDITKTKTEGEDGSIKINNVWDLYKALGGWNSYSRDENGEWNQSESSQEFISLFVSCWDNSVKDRIIHKIADQEAIKSGIGNFNYKEDVEHGNIPLNFISIDTDLFGVQSDQSHESDEDTVPALTQLVSNLSLNGAHPELVREILDTIAKSLEEGINKLNKAWDGTPEQLRELTKQVAEKLVKSLQNRNSKISALEEEALKVLDDYAAGRPLRFAAGSRSAFRKVTSDLLVELNENVLRTRFPGTPVINNPSYGVYGVYEDSKGNIFKENDLVDWALKSVKDSIKVDTQKGEDYISVALRTALQQKPELQETQITNIEEVELEDTVRTSDGRTIHITNPDELYEIEDFLKDRRHKAWKIYGKKRNLKAPNITWSEIVRDKDGNEIKDELGNPVIQKKSLWFSPAVRERHRLVNDPNATEAQKQLYLLWHRACLVGLENGYYYKTLDDFKAKRPTTIVAGSYDYKPGEQILPKRFKTILGLGNTSMTDILEQGPDFFLAKARNNVEAKNTRKIQQGDVAIVTLVRPQDEIVFRQVIKNTEINQTPYQYHDILDDKYYYTDKQGEKLFALPSPNCEVTQEIIDGKTVYTVTTTTPLHNVLHMVKDVTAYYREIGTVKDKEGNKVDTGFQYDNILTRKNNIVNTISKLDQLEISAGISKYSQELFNSFKLYNETISARIPTQAFQSFAVLKTVAFTDFDTNDGYINAYLTFFQGADFDIDKSYTLMFANKKDGTIETISPLVQTDTKEHYLDGMATLPYPDANLIIDSYVPSETDIIAAFTVGKKQNLVWSSEVAELLGIEYATEEETEEETEGDTENELSWDDILPSSFVDDYLQDLLQNGKVIEYYQAIKKLQEYLKSKKVDGEPIISRITFNILNNHNSYHVTTDGYKNKITSLIYKVAGSSANLDASQVPMASDPIIKLIDECEQETVTLRNTQDKVEYNPYNPITKWELQFQAKVGNETTGIAANALKATAALQQYHNEGYQDWKLINIGDEVDYQKSYEALPESYRFGTNKTLQSVPKNAKENYQPVTDRTGLVLDISIDEKDKDTGKSIEKRTIVKRNYVRLGDTVLDKNDGIARYKYNVLHANIPFKTIRQWKEYVWLNEYRANDPKLIARLKNNKDSGLNNLITAVEVYADMHSTTVGEVLSSILGEKEAFLDFMFFAENFRMKVADSISIFISLAVDNMKELALARMRTNADFLGMALGMLSLGIEPRDVVDTCINVIDPIFVARQANVLQGEENPDIDKIIDGLLKNKVYNVATARSLHTLHSYAQDMRAMTDLFSVNQGVPATFTTIMQFLRNKAHNKTTKEAEALIDPEKKATWIKNYVDTHFSSEEERQRITNLLNDDIDFKHLYRDQNYKQALEAYFNQFKTGFNIISLITGNPNFATLLQGLSIQVSQIAKVSVAGKFTQEAVKLFPKKFHLSDSDVSKILSVCDNFLIGETLKKLDIEFSYSSAGVTNPQLINKDAALNLKTEGGVNEFIKIMVDHIIPKYKDQRYTENLFFQYMNQKKNSTTGKLYWDIPIDGFDSNDVVNRQLIEDMAKSLLDIASDPSGFKLINGKELTVGELLTLYVMIDNGFKLGSALSTCVQKVCNEYEYNVYETYIDSVIEWDEKTRRYSGENTENGIKFVEIQTDDKGKRFKVETEDTKLLTEQLAIAKAYVEKSEYKNRNIRSSYIYQFIEQPQIKLDDILEQFGINPKSSNISITMDKSGNRYVNIAQGIGTDPIPIKIPSQGSSTRLDNIFLSTEDAIILAHLIRTNKDIKKAQTGEEDIPKKLNKKITSLFSNAGITLVSVKQKAFDNTFTTTAPYVLSNDENGGISILLDQNLMSVGYFDNEPWVLYDMLAEAGRNLTAQQKIDFYVKNFTEKKTFDGLTDNEHKKVISYINHLQNETTPQYNEIVKVTQMLDRLRNQIENDDIYYRKITEKVDGFIVGDIVEHTMSPGIEYVYLGKINGKDMFVTPNGKPSISNNLKQMVVTHRLRTRPGRLYRHFIVGNTQYDTPSVGNTSEGKININTLTRGDQVTIDNFTYYVAETFYNNGLDFAVLQDLKNNFKIVTASDLSKQNVTIAKPKLAINISKQKTIIRNIQGFNTTRDFIKNHITVGSEIVFEDSNHNLKQGVIRKINGANGKLAVAVMNQANDLMTTIDNIKELHLPKGNYIADPDILFDLQKPGYNTFNFLIYNTPFIMTGYTQVNTIAKENLSNGDIIYDPKFNYTEPVNESEETQEVNSKQERQQAIMSNSSNVNYEAYHVVHEIKDANNILYKTYILKNTLYDGNKSTTELVNVEFTNTASGNKYYTKNKEIITSDRLLKALPSRPIDNIKLQGKVMDYLEQALGVKIVIDDSLDSGEAMVKGRTILMNRNDFNGDNFLKLTVHELSHIVLAYIKLKNPDQYYTLLQNAPDIQVDTNIYKGDLQKEEQIIMFIETQLKNIKLDENKSIAEQMTTIINGAFSELFHTIKIEANNISRQITLKSLLDTSSLFEDFEEELDFDMLERLKAYDNYLKNVTKECD